MPNKYIYGLHDRGGENLLIYNGEPRGWVLVTEEIGHNPNDHRGADYQDIDSRGLNVIVRLNNAYGPHGTIPHPDNYAAFAQRAANFVAASRGCHRWIIGNETNMEREQPRQHDSDRAEPITPRLYADCYNQVRRAIKSLAGHESDEVIIAAIAPWNNQTPYEADPKGVYLRNGNGNWLKYLRDITDVLHASGQGFDAIAMHAYSHGYDPGLIWSPETMGPPFQNYFYHFQHFKQQIWALRSAIPTTTFYITEANGDGPWPYNSHGWVTEAYKAVNSWNTSMSKHKIACLILFRWMNDHEDWGMENKGGVHQDLHNAISKGFFFTRRI